MLKFEGIHVGSYIRAYDFEPCGDRPDRYIEGFICQVGSSAEEFGYRYYLVKVKVDTLWPEKPRLMVRVPMETTFDYDNRIVVFPDDKRHLYSTCMCQENYYRILQWNPDGKMFTLETEDGPWCVPETQLSDFCI